MHNSAREILCRPLMCRTSAHRRLWFRRPPSARPLPYHRLAARPSARGLLVLLGLCLAGLSACENRPIEGVADRLAFKAPDLLYARLCSRPLAVSIRSPIDELIIPPRDIPVELQQLERGAFFSDRRCRRRTAQTTIREAETSARFRLRYPEPAEIPLASSTRASILAGRPIRDGQLAYRITPALTAPGFPDPAFASNGRNVQSLQAGNDAAYAMAVDEDRFVVYAAGATSVGVGADFAVAAYDFEGRPIPSFGRGGMVTTPIGTGNDYITEAAVQPDGKLLVAGYADAGGKSNFALARYLLDGRLDEGFGQGGKLLFPTSGGKDRAYDLQLLGDGRILVTGSSIEPNKKSFIVVRLLPDGTLDPDFGTAGIASIVATTVELEPASLDEARSAAIGVQSDGKIVLAGYTHDGQRFRFALARFEPFGAVDTSFGQGGLVVTGPSQSHEALFALEIQEEDDKLLIGGYSEDATRGKALLVGRLGADGALDRSFGEGGYTIVPYKTGDNRIDTLNIHPDGSLLAAGFAYDVDHYVPVLLRLSPDGQLDPSFGQGGIAMPALTDGLIYEMYVQDDGRILFAAQSRDRDPTSGEFDFAVGRYWP